MRVVLDSTVLIDLLMARSGAVERVRVLHGAGDVPVTTPINVEEIHRGLKSDEQDSASALFDWLHVLPIGRGEAELAGSWRRDCATHGLTLSQADCLIAATAFISGAELATGNPKDFPMDELQVQHWPVGE